MPDTTVEMNGRAGGAARQDRPDAAARVAELEAEVAALRRALGEAGRAAGGAVERHDEALSRERAGRAADVAGARSAAAEAEARHGREMAAGRADLAVSGEANDALRRANAELAAGRAALRGSEERLRLILDSATDYAIIGMGLDRRVTSWNAGAGLLLGWTTEEIVGRTADIIFTPEDRGAGAPEREAEGALRDGRATNERWHVRKDGSRFWGSGLVMPLRDPAAGPGAPPLGLLKVMRDRTERRRAEEAMRDSEARFRALARASSDVLYRMSPDWAEMRQLSGGGFIADTPAPTRGWLDDYIHPDDRATVRAAIDDAIRRKGAFELEHRVRRPDGGFGWTHSRAVPILGVDGEVAEWFGAASDMTARRAAEERLRESEARFGAAFAMRTVGVVFWDGDFRLAEVNDAFLAFTGFSRAEALGRSTWDLTPEEFYPPTRRAVREMAARGEITPYEKQYFRKDGTRWWGLFAARRVGSEVMEFVLDITERKSAEAALRESEGRRRAALDAAGLGTWEWDTATGAVALDARSRDIFGLAPDWGGRADAVLDRIHPEDRARVRAESLATSAARGRLDTEYRVSLPDGGQRVVASLGGALPGGGGRPARMAGVFADVTERKRAEERRALLVNELNHRVKNTLAVVQALALQTARGALDLPAFTAAFQARLVALARAHDLLTRQDWVGLRWPTWRGRRWRAAAPGST